MLFADENPRPSLRSPTPYVRPPWRGEVRQHIVALDDLIPLEHPVRIVWAFADALDLQDLLRPGETTVASPAHTQPALLVALWLWATLEGVGSARQLAKLCVENLSYRWLCGGVQIDHQMLRDFRLMHGNMLDRLLAHSVAALVQQGVLNLELLSPGALKSQTETDAGLAHRRQRLKVLAVAAAARVQELRTVLDRDDSIADERHNRSAHRRISQQQGARVNAALAQMKNLFRTRSKKNVRRGLER